MNNWNSGYVTDIDYIYGYYTELNPLQSQLVMLNKGIVFPKFETACELGYGQGISTNIHAAASATRWYGTDFIPAQASFAQELAAASKANAKLYDEAFQDFCARSDLPDFDFIGIHGTWSWISESNREIITDFIKRKLKVGGLLYFSYNALPGWTPLAPMRHLMTQHADTMSAKGLGITNRIDNALNFGQRLLETKPLFSKVSPLIEKKFGELSNLNRNYLAHEYFNKDWMPMYFSDVAERLTAVKLEYACSAHYLDQIDAINLTQEHASFLNEIRDHNLKESVRDFITNNQFRRDYWVRGKRTMSRFEAQERLKQFKVVLCCARNSTEIKAEGALGPATLNSAAYDVVLDAMSDLKPHSIDEIADEISGKRNIGYAEIIEIMLVLISGKYAAPVQSADEVAAAKNKTDALNNYLIDRVRMNNSVEYLASPLTGGGIRVDQFQQHFLYAIKNGLIEPAEWVNSTWQHLASRNQNIIVKGKELKTEEENIAELRERAYEFEKNNLPVLKALQVI